MDPKKILIQLKGLLPLLFFTALLAGLLLLKLFFDFTAPAFVRWILLILWLLTAFGYVAQMQLLKRFGGALVLASGFLILVTMLLPRDQLERYYRRASSVGTGQTVETHWDRLYGKDITRDVTFRDIVQDGIERVVKMDIYLAGQVLAFALLTLALSICFLFPEDLYHPRRYAGGVAKVAGGALFFALQAELLQILSPTREVVLLGLLESGAGILAGLVLFIPVHFSYAVLRGRHAPSSLRFNVLGTGVDAVDMRDCLRRFEKIIQGGFDSGCSDPLSTVNQQPSNPDGGCRPVMTTALGVAGIMEARRNPQMQRILNESVLNTPDGMPLVWLGQLFGYRNIRRVYGPDLLRDVCAYSASRGWKHFFYGSAPGVVDRLKSELERKNPGIQIVGTVSPPFRPLTEQEEQELIAQVREAKPDIFWIGISTPKQLYFMDRMKDKLDCKIICPVGYAFDVNAGIEQDAPEWIKFCGLQWLHRAIKQPRLWKRYLPDNPRFVLESALQVFRLRKYPMFFHERTAKPKTDPEGYPRFPAGVVSLSAMTLESARDRILNWISTGQKHYVNICTADTMVNCFDRPDMAKIVENAGMATTDGMPLVWLAHRYGFKEAARVYGPDLMRDLCAATAGVDCCSLMVDTEPSATQQLSNVSTKKKCVSHFFYGATEEVLDRLRNNLLEKFPGLHIAGMYAPPFRPLSEKEKDEVAERINASGADIVWCGLGTPKQDYWVAEFRPRLNCSVILAVGAAFNFCAGEVRQAPRWMMRSGFEWLFRLWAEPKRLWRRYLVGNPRFILLTWRQFIRYCNYRDRDRGKEQQVGVFKKG